MKAYSISEAEWKVMQVLWRQKACTWAQLLEELSASGWSESTIKTLLRRLVEKAYVTVDKTNGKPYVYQACVSQQECQCQEAEHFLSRVFGGSVSMLVSTLTREKGLSKQDKEALLQMIEQMEDGE